MQSRPPQTPPLSGAARRLTVGERMLCLIGPVLAVGLFAVILHLMPLLQDQPVLKALFLRPCQLREGTGVPCPFCGGTRAAIAAAHGEWGQAIALNPAGAILVALAPVAGAWLALCALAGRDWGLSAVGALTHGRGRFLVLAAGVAALWAYVIIAHGVFHVG